MDPSILRVTRKLTCKSFRSWNKTRNFSTSRVVYKGNNSSKLWLRRQMTDPYVKQAAIDNLRCRSAYKLIEMNEKYNLLSPGDVVIDCGASPGSWSQVASDTVQSVNGQGRVVGIDLLHIKPLQGVTFLTKKDFTIDDTQREVLDCLQGRLANIVLSDMAPNSTGTKTLDHDVICDLCLSVLKFSARVLDRDGDVLCKLWEGGGTNNLIKVMERMFNSTKVVKPKASRVDSAEIYLLGKGFKLR